ncbi:LuxR-family transcriptional regulator [Streptomyces hygroscopicus subsp. jinggangensis 5008]|nr:LuxR-family transcriptional regulator [Streptomyces hygroscopicus subsp. jinggangensis 5008]AGF59926.1 LuxR-family transcriptional regulator [Streptomyces hygroscopicus subsp. jinggangensis TL01]
MIGRDDELRQLSAFVTAAERQALVLRGETGVGKSALLDHVAKLASGAGHGVIRAAGVEAESGLPFAGLHQLVHPLLPSVDGLDQVHRDVFATVYGRSGGKPPSVMSLGIAVLDLLSLVSSAKPLLLLLDDGQWLDASSVAVIGFVGRRLNGGSVKLLVGLRSDVASGFDTAALPVLPVGSLPDEAARRLLDLRRPGLDTHVRRLVLDQARGNPLALLELSADIDGDRTGGGAARLLGSPDASVRLPVPRRLQHVYGTRIKALGDDVRQELLRGALDGVGATPGTALAPGSRRYRMRDAEEALAAGLLSIDPVSGDFVFRHPLVRSTVVQTATPNERRAAHAALACVHRDDVERSATHLAAATVDPDEEVAAALEAAAESATRRGSAVAAVAWLTRAAELSENREDRSRRLGDAAFAAGHAGLFEQAQRLVRSDHAAGTDEPPASVVTSAYLAFFEDGDVRHSHRQVVTAIENLGEREPGKASDVLTRLVNLLLAIDQYAGDPAQWEETRALLGSLGDPVPARSLIYQDAWGDVVRHGAGVAERVEREFTDLSAMEPWDITRLSVAAYHVDTLSHYRPHLQRTVDREAETGFVRNSMTMLHLIMLDQMAVGEWDEAERTGQRDLELTSSHGYALLAHHTRAYLGLLAAMRGQVERARELQATVDAWARPRGVGFLTQITDAIGTTAALSEGDYEAAYLHAIGITPPGTFTPYAHQAPRTLLDLVEAALHTGRSEQARTHALAAHHAHLPDISPRLALTTHGALAMTATDPTEADHHYHHAETHPSAPTFPFELARIRLAHGIHLRHTQGSRSARPLLVQAVETFERLGAPTWAERARAELRASGLATRVTSAQFAELTWQERQIADLAAGGLTNKEIGQRMHLSPRTVSSHLYRVFPKLGITSRAALRDALAKLEEGS